MSSTKKYVERRKEVEAVTFNGENIDEILSHVGQAAQIGNRNSHDDCFSSRKQSTGIKIDYLGGSLIVPDNSVVVCELNGDQRSCHVMPATYFNKCYQEKD